MLFTCYQVNVFSDFPIISLPTLHYPSIQHVIQTWNLKHSWSKKSQTYCSLYNFLAQGCWIVVVQLAQMKNISPFFISCIDWCRVLVSSPHLLDSEVLLTVYSSWFVNSSCKYWIASYDCVLVINLNMLWPMDDWFIIYSAYSLVVPSFCILPMEHSY
jgi:hypothetical protein